MTSYGAIRQKILSLTVMTVAGILCSHALADDDIPFDVNTTFQDSTNYDKTLQESVPKIKEPVKAPVVKKNMTSKDDASLAGLGGLSSFSDIAVINRKYLPKTGRFEVFPNIGMVLNDAFFTDFSYGARLAYAFSEKYAVEVTGLWISSSNKTVTNELAGVGITATAFATPSSFYGLDFKWSPLYGKMGWMNKSITPFDIYFSLGGGITATNQSTNPPTVHVGFGEAYAVSKWMAVRLDISWYGYQSTSQVSTGGPSSTGSYSNIYASAGMSFFFPEAEYR